MYARVQDVVVVVKCMLKNFGRDDQRYNRASLLWLLGRTVLTQLASYQLLIAKSHLYFTKGKTGSIPKLDGALRTDCCSPAWTDQRVCSTEQLVKQLCNYA